MIPHRIAEYAFLTLLTSLLAILAGTAMAGYISDTLTGAVQTIG